MGAQKRRTWGQRKKLVGAGVDECTVEAIGTWARGTCDAHMPLKPAPGRPMAIAGEQTDSRVLCAGGRAGAREYHTSKHTQKKNTTITSNKQEKHGLPPGAQEA